MCERHLNPVFIKGALKGETLASVHDVLLRHLHLHTMHAVGGIYNNIMSGRNYTIHQSGILYMNSGQVPSFYTNSHKCFFIIFYSSLRMFTLFKSFHMKVFQFFTIFD